MANRKKRTAAKAARAAQRAAAKHPGAVLAVLALLLVAAIVAALVWYFLLYRRPQPAVPPAAPSPTGELSIHFLELGNAYTGDCVFIRIGDTEVLVDGGSREDSAETIEAYVDAHCSDGVLEYVVVTHADRDHIAAFAGNKSHPSLFERFDCRVIVDFPRTNKSTQIYERYVAARDAEVAAGAVRYTALQCWNEEDGAKRSYELAEGVELEFLYNYYYEHSVVNENDYSVCFKITQGENVYLFTGDLEKDGEARLVANNDLPQCKLFKAGHHGSKTSSTEALLSVIRPEYVCVCCCAGSTEYTDNGDNTFPTQDMIDRVSKYTDKIFVTTRATEDGAGFAPLNGNIVVRSDGVSFSVEGSANSTVLKDTEWFAANRRLPARSA